MRPLSVDFVVVRPVVAVPDKVGPPASRPGSMMGGESNREYLL